MIPDETNNSAVGDVRGFWQRTLYRRGTAAADASLEAFWLQAPLFFADLRRPVDRPSFQSVGCLRDLGTEHLNWLARQQAFAGRLRLNGTLAWWQRAIDLHPESPFADRAQLQQNGETLEEYGTELPYVEHWQRQSAMLDPCWGVQLRRTSDGRSGFLVRAGKHLMWARARGSALPPGRTLIETLQATDSLEAKQDLLDLEVSLASRSPDAASEWSIDCSTLPFKEGRRCSIEYAAGTQGNPAYLDIDDVGARGERLIARWEILESDAADAATL